jgi:hypothetical protein
MQTIGIGPAVLLTSCLQLVAIGLLLRVRKPVAGQDLPEPEVAPGEPDLFRLNHDMAP